MFGVYFGNSNICLAYHKDGRIDIPANQAGDRVTPAVVASGPNDEFLVGLSAKAGIARNGHLTVVNCKQFLDDNHVTDDLIRQFNRDNLCPITNEPLCYNLTLDNITKTVTPLETLGHLLKSLYVIGQQTMQMDKLPAVLSVPLHFSKGCRQEIKKIAEDVGFQIMQIVSDPAAALNAYEIIPNPSDSVARILVFRVGGVTCDATLMQIKHGLFTVIGQERRTDLGGNIFTNVLVNFIADEFCKKFKLDPNESRRSLVKINQQAEICKHVLSTMQTASCFVESLMDGVDWCMNISRARFESLIAPSLNDFKMVVETLLTKTNNSNEKIDGIIICGGSMKIPKMQVSIQNMFPDATLYKAYNPDEVIAIGCAKHGTLLQQKTDVWNGESDFVFMDIECSKHPVYIKLVDVPTSIPILVFEAETPMYTENTVNIQLPELNKRYTFIVYELYSDGTEKILCTVKLPTNTQPISKVLITLAQQIEFKLINDKK